MNISQNNNQWFKRLAVSKRIPNDTDGYPEDIIYLDGIPFSGLSHPNNTHILGILNGSLSWSMIQEGKTMSICFQSLNGVTNGYTFGGKLLRAYELGLECMIEETSNEQYSCIQDEIARGSKSVASRFQEWMSDRAFNFKTEPKLYENGRDYYAIYEQQAHLKTQIILTDNLPAPIRYVAAVDVGYDMLDLRIAASLVVYDLDTHQVILTKNNQADIKLPHYCNDLFPHTDLEVVKPLFQDLPVRPDFVICNASGLAHPRRLGLACYIGVEFDLPAFGCTRDRVVGGYEPKDLKAKAGSTQPLKWAGQVGVGNALRISTGKLPVFVSAGHQMTLETATQWTRKLKKVKIEGTDATDRQLSLLQRAEQLVTAQLEERTKLLFLETVG